MRHYTKSSDVPLLCNMELFFPQVNSVPDTIAIRSFVYHKSVTITVTWLNEGTGEIAQYALCSHCNAD